MMKRRALLLAALGARAAWAQPLVIERGGARLALQVDPALSAATRAAVPGWVDQAAAAVAGYFGRFPLPAAEIEVAAAEGSGVRHGRTRPGEPPHLRVTVAADASPAQLREDWVLVHEMVHLAVPRLARSHNWLHEGIATYVEGVARARAGMLSARRLWIELAQQLPQGQPRPGEGGLDDTFTWARTYWGGALFCLVADLRLRERGAAGGLQQALQGVLAAGGSYAARWDIDRLLEVADAATGQHTLGELYTQMKDRPVRVDLESIWARLGVDGTRLRDDAPQAALRRAITGAEPAR